MDLKNLPRPSGSSFDPWSARTRGQTGEVPAQDQPQGVRFVDCKASSLPPWLGGMPLAPESLVGGEALAQEVMKALDEPRDAPSKMEQEELAAWGMSTWSIDLVPAQVPTSSFAVDDVSAPTQQTTGVPEGVFPYDVYVKGSIPAICAPLPGSDLGLFLFDKPLEGVDEIPSPLPGFHAHRLPMDCITRLRDDVHPLVSPALYRNPVEGMLLVEGVDARILRDVELQFVLPRIQFKANSKQQMCVLVRGPQDIGLACERTRNISWGRPVWNHYIPVSECRVRFSSEVIGRPAPSKKEPAPRGRKLLPAPEISRHDHPYDVMLKGGVPATCVRRPSGWVYRTAQRLPDRPEVVPNALGHFEYSLPPGMVEGPARYEAELIVPDMKLPRNAAVRVDGVDSSISLVLNRVKAGEDGVVHAVVSSPRPLTLPYASLKSNPSVARWRYLIPLIDGVVRRTPRATRRAHGKAAMSSKTTKAKRKLAERPAPGGKPGVARPRKARPAVQSSPPSPRGMPVEKSPSPFGELAPLFPELDGDGMG